MGEYLKQSIDFAAAGTILASLLGWLPPLAAGLAIVWYLFLIYDRIKYGPKK